MDSLAPLPNHSRVHHAPMSPLEAESIEVARDIVRRAHAISPSPSLLRLEAQLRRGDASARQLGQLIEGSPALAARVLRMANSAFYSPRDPVVGLGRAVVLLGETVLRQLVLTSLIMSRQASRRSPRQALAAARLMGNAVRSGVVCRSLADMTRIAQADDAFAAGLLHDLGHVYLLDDIGETYGAYLLEATPMEDADEASLERELVLAGTTHQDVGSVFAYDWNLPSALGRVLHEHHDPHAAGLPALVRASDWLVRELNHPGTAISPTLAGSVDSALGSLGIDRASWERRVPVVRDEYAELLTAFDALAA